MRRFLFLSVIFSAFLFANASAQITNAPEQNCPGAIPVCHGDYQQNQAYSGFGTIDELTTSPCPSGNNGALSSGEKNGVWYVMNVVCDGMFAMTIMPNVGTEDYDWALWNITGGGCSLIYNYATNTTNPYLPYLGTCVPTYFQGASNYAPNLGIGGWTGITQNPTLLLNGQFNPSFPVTAGQTFVLLVSNFSSSQNGYHLTFDSSTACLYDTVKPRFVSAGSKCGFVSDKISVGMSVPILCSTIDPDGSDFYITPPVAGDTIIGASSSQCVVTGGAIATTLFDLKFQGVLPPGTYWLHVRQGNDTNTTVDLCNNKQSITDSIQFILAPADPPVVATIDTPACSKVRLIFNRGVKCTTVDPDGSDFDIRGPGNIKVNVTKVLAVSCNDYNLVDTLDVFFDASIPIPGLYTINLVPGKDGDIITDTCGLIVASPLGSFFVFDGGVTATATPNVLCAPGYFNLGAATVMAPPPAPIVTCGANGTVVTSSNTYQLGTTTNTMSAAHTPFGGAQTQRRTRMLYTVNELNALGITSGTISQVAFNITTKNTTKPFQNFTIKMGCTADTLLDTSINHPGAFSPALEIVYGPKDYYTSTGWNFFQLDNTYDWAATQSLLVEICYSDTIAIGNDIVEGSPIPNTSFCNYNSSKIIQGCAMSSAGGVFDVNRPNLRFNYTPPLTPLLSWVWTPSNYLYNGLADTTTAFAYQTTVYTATIMDKDNCYRRDTAKLIVSVRNPHVSPLDSGLCIGTSETLNAEGGVTYLWYPAKGLACATCATTLATLDTTTILHVGIYDQYGCGDTLQARLRINNLPVIQVNPKDTLVLYQVPVQLNAYAPGARYYQWRQAAGLDNADIPNPKAAPDTNTLYIVTVVDTNNCLNTDTVNVRIYELGVEIPSAFTPNGDGKNDVFRVANLTSQKVLEFKVFNRWGQQIYSAENNNGWDGTYGSVLQGLGTYSYLIRVSFHDGSLKTFMGSVTLIR